jgi:hypothetical protein
VVRFVFRVTFQVRVSVKVMASTRSIVIRVRAGVVLGSVRVRVIFRV